MDKATYIKGGKEYTATPVTAADMAKEATLVMDRVTGEMYERRRRMTGLDFQELRIGRLFHLNGNDYMKQSTRTAKMLSTGRVFYIGKTEYIHPIAY